MPDYLRLFAFRRRALAFLFSFGASLIFTFSIIAQTPQPAPSQTPPARAEEEDSNVAERRTSVMLLITALADEARTFRNEALRARIQARAADALWDTDTERARALFRRAWEAAEASDAQSEPRTNEERERQMRARPGRTFMIPSPANTRGEVLRLAARRDRALGEELLARFIEAREREAEEMRNRTPASPTNDASQSSPNPTEPPAEVLQRLALARRLLEDGDTERALNFASPALTNVTMQGVAFLSFLRERDAASADRRFAEMLQRAANDPTTDAATVSVLSSYVLTPFLFVVSGRNGIMSSQIRGESVPPPSLDARLRAQFFRTAAQILLRPIASVNDDRTYAGRAGTYFTIARLLPAFDQFAPEHSPALRAKLNALTPDAPESFRNGTDSSLTRGIIPESERRDELSDTLAAIERTTDQNRRNELYASAAQTAAARGDSRAREFADRITNPDLRSRVRAFSDFVSVQRAARQRNADEVLRVARTGELSPFQRVWAFVEAAEILKRTESSRVPEILEEALRDARRAESTERPRALAGIITNLFAVDRTRAWELMPELIRVANAAEDFSGEDAQVVARLETGGSVWAMTDDAPNFDLNDLFGALSEIDMLRATEYARSFTGESPRAVSILAIARAELNRLRQMNRRSEN